MGEGGELERALDDAIGTGFNGTIMLRKAFLEKTVLA